MISVNDLRAGATFEENGDIFKVLAFEHIRGGDTPSLCIVSQRSCFYFRTGHRDLNIFAKPLFYPK